MAGRGRPPKTQRENFEEKETLFHKLSDTQIMALTMWAEARGEPREGKIGVGSTILERVDHRKWDGKTVHEVCLWPYQFSCYLEDNQNYKHLFAIADNFDDALQRFSSLRECLEISEGMICGKIARNTTALQYLNPNVAEKTKEKWIEAGMKVVMKIGRHEWFE